MTKRIDLRTALGGCLLAAALLLASPGVRVAHGDGAPMSRPVGAVDAGATQDAPFCPAEMAPERTAEALARVRAALAEAPGADDVVVLNGRGFNYPSPRRADPAGVEREALRERRQP